MSCLFALVGLLLAGTIAAFLRHVTLVSGLMAFLVFLGLVLTFLLGAFVGYDHAWYTQQLSNRSPDAIAGSANTISSIGTATRKPQKQAGQRATLTPFVFTSTRTRCLIGISQPVSSLLDYAQHMKRLDLICLVQQMEQMPTLNLHNILDAN